MIIEVPEMLKDLCFVKCALKSKKPINDDWPNTIINYEEIVKYAACGCNYGINCGHRGLAGIDFDDPGFFEDINDFLPSTFMVKSGMKGYHAYLYVKNWSLGKIVHIFNKDGKHVGEIRYSGAQLIGPNSIHPDTGNPYTVFKNRPIAQMDEKELLALLGNYSFKKIEDVKSEKFKLPVGPIPQGQQDDLLSRYALSLVSQGQTRQDVGSMLNFALSACRQDPQKPFTENDINRWIESAYRKFDEGKTPDKTPEKETALILKPFSAESFKKLDIPPVEFWVDGLLQKRGRMMISAQSNVGKSFFLLSMLASLCSGEDKFLGHFKNDPSKPNVLYIDLEMGESSLQTRLKGMGKITDIPNLYVVSLSGWNMLDDKYKSALEKVILDKKIDITAIDPLGSMWLGDENKRESVKGLTDYLDTVRQKFLTAIALPHHWRKASKEFRQGGEMAAGSYGWAKWLDSHVTLQGTPESLVLTCSKLQNQKRWEQMRLKFVEETMSFKILGGFQNIKHFTDDDLLGIFNSFNSESVSRSDFLTRGKEVCCERTLRNLLDVSKFLNVNKDSRPHTITKKSSVPEQITLLEGIEAWDE